MLRWIRNRLRARRTARDAPTGPCLSIGFPPLGDTERHLQEVGRGEIPEHLYQALRAEEESVTTAMGLSRAAAHVPCLWYDPLENRCRYRAHRPLACRPETNA